VGSGLEPGLLGALGLLIGPVVSYPEGLGNVKDDAGQGHTPLACPHTRLERRGRGVGGMVGWW